MNFETEQKYYFKSKEIRNKLFQPLLKIIYWLNITPNQLSFSGVVSMLLFFIFFEKSFFFSISFLLLSVLLDWIDGPYARYRKIDSDKGKFVDMVCDNLSFTIFIIAVFKFGLISGTISLLLAYFMLLSKVFRSIYRGVKMKTDWIFTTSAGFFPNFVVFIAYSSYIFSKFFNISNFNIIYFFLVITLFFDVVKYFKKIIKINAI